MAQIFLSYAHEDFDLAQKIYFALSNLKHQVFFDRDILQVGDEYNFKIIDNVRKSDFCILLLSPDYFSEESYCRTELNLIQRNWPIPQGNVFPFMVREVPFEMITNYLSSITISKKDGSLVAEVVQVVQDRLLGFEPGDSVSNKIRRLEIQREIEELDAAWTESRKNYLVMLNNKQVAPSTELASFTMVVLLCFSMFGYLFFTRVNIEFFGVLPTLLPLILSFIAFFYINGNAKKLRKAERDYMIRRNEILKKMPAPDVDLLAMYRRKRF